MDRTFAEVLKDAHTASSDFPHLREVTDEISTLEQRLGHPSTSRMPVNHQATITTPTSGIRSTEGYAEMPVNHQATITTPMSGI